MVTIKFDGKKLTMNDNGTVKDIASKPVKNHDKWLLWLDSNSMDRRTVNVPHRCISGAEPFEIDLSVRAQGRTNAKKSDIVDVWMYATADELRKRAALSAAIENINNQLDDMFKMLCKRYKDEQTRVKMKVFAESFGINIDDLKKFIDEKKAETEKADGE